MQDGTGMNVTLTNERCLGGPDPKLDSTCEFWRLVNLNGFPEHLTFGRLGNFGVNTLDFIHDLVRQDIISNYTCIPRSHNITNFAFLHGELGEEVARALNEYLSSYLDFRDKTTSVNSMLLVLNQKVG
jgi:hypothetical protein